MVCFEFNAVRTAKMSTVSQFNVGIVRDFNVGIIYIDVKLFTDVASCMVSLASNVGLLMMPAVT